MSTVQFVPKDTTDDSVWPREIVGDGFIHLTLNTVGVIPPDVGVIDESIDPDETWATYVDQFGERVHIMRHEPGRFSGDIRED